MIDISKAKKLSVSANELRNQAANMNKLLEKIGTSYEGKDAQACGDAIYQLQNEMKTISNELDHLAAKISNTAKIK